MKYYSSLIKALNKRNINVKRSTIYDQMALWKSWFRGNVEQFHTYKVVVNGKTCDAERLTTNMAYKLCDDLGKLLWTEKTQINLSNKKATQRLWSVLDSQENSFSINFPNFIKTTLALGNGATILYVKNGKTTIDYVDGDVIIPFKYTNSYVRGLITVSREVEEEDENTRYYTHLTYHEFDGKRYTCRHELYVSTAENDIGVFREGEFASRYPGIQDDVVDAKFPRFQILKPNLLNNYDMDSPLGISIYANSIDRLKAVDLKYDSFMNEFELGKKRIMVDRTSLKGGYEAGPDGRHQYIQYFDKNDKVYVAVNGGVDAKSPVKEIDFTLRANEHIDAINAELNWLSDSVGLGANFYKFDGTSIRTAKEVMSENNEAFRTRNHHLILIDDLVYNLVYSICEMEGLNTNTINILHDDSIIEDADTKRVGAQVEVAQNLRSRLSYLMEFRGLSEEDAQKELDRITLEQQGGRDLFEVTEDGG